MNDIIKDILYTIRNIIYSQIFTAIEKYAHGDILDVGGGIFYTQIRKIKLNYRSYTILDRYEINENKFNDTRMRFIRQNAEEMNLGQDSFDTVLCIHMLEHTFRPLDVIKEISRVLKRDGVAIFLIPQTSIPHDIPEHYYNFTRYFIKRALIENGFKIESIEMLGGSFRTIASHLFHLPLYIFNHKLYRDNETRRDLAFYFTLPLKLVLLPILFAITYLLSFGDIKEVANNILVVARKG